MAADFSATTFFRVFQTINRSYRRYLRYQNRSHSHNRNRYANVYAHKCTSRTSLQSNRSLVLSRIDGNKNRRSRKSTPCLHSCSHKRRKNRSPFARCCSRTGNRYFFDNRNGHRYSRGYCRNNHDKCFGKTCSKNHPSRCRNHSRSSCNHSYNRSGCHNRRTNCAKKR